MFFVTTYNYNTEIWSAEQVSYWAYSEALRLKEKHTTNHDAIYVGY
jgi:hypothetical protein